MTIQLVPYPMKRSHRQGRDNKRVYVPAMGFAARRKGALLVTASKGNVRTWTTEERARAALEMDYPGECVVLEEERKTA